MVVTIVSAAQFESHVPNPATAVLRIYDPIDDWSADAARQQGAGWGRFDALAFWDIGRAGLGLVERLVIRLLGRSRPICLAVGGRLFGDDIPWHPFLPADALDIRRFADGLEPAGIRNVIVVCSNGRTRGTTVGNWIARHLGLDMPPQQGWQRESDTILDTLTRLCPRRHQARRLDGEAKFAH